MKNLTYETLLRRPKLLEEIQQAARRERSAALGEQFLRLLKAFTSREPRRAVGPRLAH